MELFLAICMLLLAAFLLRSEWEKLQLSCEHYIVRTGKLKKGGNLRIVFLSDLHHYLPAIHNREHVIETIAGEKPDAVIIGGDMLCVSKKNGAKTDTRTALSLIRDLSERFPVFYGEGNHEIRFLEKDPEGYAAYVAELLGFGVRYLSDQAAPLTGEVTVSGASIEKKYYQKLFPGFSGKVPADENFLRDVSGLLDRGQYNIMIVHSPMYLAEAGKAGADLVLSGHMHGGTIRLPGGRGLMTPQFQFFVRECSGEHRDGDTVMIVNRGLGTHSVRIRIHDLPEISVIDIEGNG